jgi:hypothetical protein
MEQQGNEDHAVQAASPASLPVRSFRHHRSSSGGSVIIPNLSTPAFRTSAITSTTNP